MNQRYLGNVDGACDLSLHTEFLQSLSQAQLDGERNEKWTSLFNGEGVSGAGSQMDSTEHRNGDTLCLDKSLDVCATSFPECPVALKVSPAVHAETNSLCKSYDYSRNDRSSLPSCSSVLQGFSPAFQASEASSQSSKSSLEYSQECLEFLASSSELVPVSSEAIVKHLGTAKLLPDAEDLDHSVETFEVLSSPRAECVPFSQAGQEPDSGDGPEIIYVSSTPQKKADRQLVDVIGPLGDPESPFSTSLDNVDVFMLPEASSSPSGDNSLQETTNDLSSAQETTPLVSEVDTDLLQRQKPVSEPLIDLTGTDCVPDVLEENINTKVPNDNAKTPPRLGERKLPARSSRGMRLESIVMNINSSRYNISDRNKSGKKSFESTDVKMRRSNRLLGKNRKCTSEEKPKVVAKKQKRSNSESCKLDTSVLEEQTSVNSLQKSLVRFKRKVSKDQSPQSVNPQVPQKDKSSDVTFEDTLSMVVSPKSTTKSQHFPSKRSQKIQKSPTKSPKSLSKSPKTKNIKPIKKKRSPRAKIKCRAKKKRSVFTGQNASSMFSPKEPEIKLKYVNYKEEKRDLKTNSFEPFIRVQRKGQLPSVCTLVNYSDEVRMSKKHSQAQRVSTDFVSATVPSTSCLYLGRMTMQGDQQRALVCCLCGQSANAMDLGDLHGPYYSEAYRPPTNRSKEGPGAKEEDSSDSDLSNSESSCGTTKWMSIKSNKQRQWSSAKGFRPSAKHPQADTEDWYSPPVVPLGPCEYWLHEDCGVWSAGVFLVRGKVYGLEEAVRAAQSTMCSSCGDKGASLGCLFKGCANKYHFRCALHSDCVLTEENLSIRCRKHRNKTIKVSCSSSRRDDR